MGRLIFVWRANRVAKWWLWLNDFLRLYKTLSLVAKLPQKEPQQTYPFFRTWLDGCHGDSTSIPFPIVVPTIRLSNRGTYGMPPTAPCKDWSGRCSCSYKRPQPYTQPHTQTQNHPAPCSSPFLTMHAPSGIHRTRTSNLSYHERCCGVLRTATARKNYSYERCLYEPAVYYGVMKDEGVWGKSAKEY